MPFINCKFAHKNISTIVFLNFNKNKRNLLYGLTASLKISEQSPFTCDHMFTGSACLTRETTELLLGSPF